MNGQEFTDLSERMARVEEKCDNIEKDIKSIDWKLGRYMEHYRPPWPVVAIITLLSCTSVGLIVRTFT